MPRHRKRGSGSTGRANCKEPDMKHVVDTVCRIVEATRVWVCADHDNTLEARAQYLLVEVYLRRAHDQVLRKLEE